MKVEKITVHYERKFNVGDYSAFSVSVMPTVIIEEGDDLAKVMEHVWGMCERNVMWAAIPVLNDYGVQAKHGYNGVTKKDFYLGKEVTNNAD